MTYIKNLSTSAVTQRSPILPRPPSTSLIQIGLDIQHVPVAIPYAIPALINAREKADRHLPSQPRLIDPNDLAARVTHVARARVHSLGQTLVALELDVPGAVKLCGWAPFSCQVGSSKDRI